MTTPINTRDERIDVRLNSELKQLLTRAASYSGMSLTSFLVSVAADRAKTVVAEHEATTLTARDWNAFASALDAAEPERPKLEAAAQKYHARRNRPDGG